VATYHLIGMAGSISRFPGPGTWACNESCRCQRRFLSAVCSDEFL